jgi:hypothetical protein
MAKTVAKEKAWTPQQRKKRRHAKPGLRHRKKLGPRSHLR